MLIKLSEPSLDSWTIIFLLFAFQAVVTGVAFCVKSSGTRYANRFIGLILFAFVLTLISYTAFRTGYIIYVPFLGIAGDFSVLLFGPLFYFYLLKILNGKDYKVRYAFHLLPAVLYTLYFLPPFFMADAQSVIAYLNNPITFLLPWLKIIQLAIYGFGCYVLILRSSLLKEIKKWALIIFGFYLSFTSCLVACYILLHLGADGSYPVHLIYTLISVFISFVAVFAYIRPKIFDGYVLAVPSALLPAGKYKNTGLTGSAAIELFERLNGLMESERIYRQNDLNLDVLAEKLNSTRHHLSQVINEKSGMNFFEFINHLRIAEAKQLLAENEDLNIIEVAYRVGFNNKVSFNNAFKRYAEVTPSDYRKRLIESKKKGKS